MSDRSTSFDLSRRKVLAGLGGIGLASAGAGLGTSAYLNDTESFEGNTITAGTLDLKVDWQQSYYGPTESWEFVNAHPDHDGDGEQSIVIDDEQHQYSDEGRNLVDHLTCENLGQNYEANFGDQDSLVSLSDVKPGDEGEITFSLHLCDNPGYVWMQAGNVGESGGAHPEPEQDVDAENAADLAENVDVQLWYDEDCDNRVNRADVMLTIDVSGSMLYDEYGGVVDGDNGILGHDETTKIDLVEQGTKNLVNELDSMGADAQVGVVFFNGSSDGSPHIQLGAGLTDDLSTLTASGGALDGLRQTLATIVGASSADPYASVDIATGTFIGEGLQRAQTELGANGRTQAEAVNLVFSNGNSFSGGDGTTYISPTSAADDARAASPAPATDVFTVGIGPDANDATLTQMAGEDGSAGNDASYYRDVDDPGDLPGTFEGLAGLLTSEVVFFEGTLDDALATLSEGDGIPLDADRTTEGRACFDPHVGHCLGFSWEIPAEVGNEIQGDTVSFDLGFYAEQCRNNDGTGSSDGSTDGTTTAPT
ncbi:vWA domain-containing protein [Halobacterium sp. CBA1126]|uniref:vWA domain-containing protein n=1 Tax=Halobacterium sp. CBA1126 TaxID=2668074 RepID=UPI0012F8C07F|nr:vWA domain-containing protein [Halobacterium sp. CBA1126]MUV60177.1 VWA domain-containing protein [Halobacterium sp. CBA1126]